MGILALMVMLGSSSACEKCVCSTTETDSFTEGHGRLDRLSLRVHTWLAMSHSDEDFPPALLFECFRYLCVVIASCPRSLLCQDPCA